MSKPGLVVGGEKEIGGLFILFVRHQNKPRIKSKATIRAGLLTLSYIEIVLAQAN
jgi:hypothetical protein